MIGALGMDGAALIGSARLMQGKVIADSFGLTGSEIFEQLDLPLSNDIVFGGWDFRDVRLSDLLAEHRIGSLGGSADIFDRDLNVWPGIATALDIPVEQDHVQRVDVVNYAECINNVRGQIRSFRAASKLDIIIVMYVGSPARRTEGGLEMLDVAQLISGGRDAATSLVPSSLLYAIASILEKASFVDYTPSETLECTSLLRLAEDCGVQVAGRDGSTGQTYIKHVMASALIRRGLRITSWYSTNVLGNHDGIVLTMAGHGDTKVADKKYGLERICANSQPEHVVRIDLVKDYGDAKESWDAIELEGFLGSRASLRINWRGEDSMLAAPMMLDIIRLMAYGDSQGHAGLQPDLGFFFKRPIGIDSVEPDHLFKRLCDRYQLPG